MSILVTGGTGLVGARLLQRFADSKIACRGLVRAGKSLPQGVTPIDADILEPATLVKAVGNITAVVHLAATFRTPDTDLIWKVNVEGTRHLIDAVKQHAPKARFIMASTGLVYGNEGKRPGKEGDEVAPKQDYPASKVAAEKELRQSGLAWSILRLPFVYGDQDGHLESLPKLGARFKFHPASRFSLVHHRDVATVVKLALTGKLDSQIVNVTDDAATSVYELYQIIGAEMEPSSEPLAHPWHGVMDGSLARSLGFTPSVATVHQAARENIL